MAAGNSGGIVIAQVERVADAARCNPRQVKIPGVLVDCVVVAEKPDTTCRPSSSSTARPSPARSGCRCAAIAADADGRAARSSPAARRWSCKPNAVVNLGIGMPEGVADVAAEEQIIDLMTLTAEPGVIGGVPAGGLGPSARR